MTRETLAQVLAKRPNTIKDNKVKQCLQLVTPHGAFPPAPLEKNPKK